VIHQKFELFFGVVNPTPAFDDSYQYKKQCEALQEGLCFFMTSEEGGSPILNCSSLFYDYFALICRMVLTIWQFDAK